MREKKGSGNKKLFKVSEAALKTGIPVSTIRRYCQAGKIEGAFQQGGYYWVIPVDWVIANMPGKYKGFLSVAEAAKKAGVSRQSIQAAAARGDVEYIVRRENARGEVIWIDTESRSFKAYIKKARIKSARAKNS